MSKLSDERASSMVETAIALPVVLFLTFGLVQWGLIMSASITLRSASATAARLVALANPPLDDTALRNAAKDAVEPVLDRNILGVTVTTVGTTKTISLSYQYPLLLPYVVPGQVGGYLTLSAAATGR